MGRHSKPVTIDTAITGDDLLTALSRIDPDNRAMALAARGCKILREAADLCGADSTEMGKRTAIRAILENF